MFTFTNIEISSATNLIFSTGSSATSSLHLPNLCVISTNTCSSFSSLASVSMASAATGPCTVFQPELYTERVLSGVGEESWYSGTTALIQTLCLDEWRESHSHGWLELLPAAWLPWQDGGDCIQPSPEASKQEEICWIRVTSSTGKTGDKDEQLKINNTHLNISNQA